MDTLCMKCGKSFADKYGLQRHLNNKKKPCVATDLQSKSGYENIIRAIEQIKEKINHPRRKINHPRRKNKYFRKRK